MSMHVYRSEKYDRFNYILTLRKILTQMGEHSTCKSTELSLVYTERDGGILYFLEGLLITIVYERN